MLTLELLELSKLHT